MWRNQNRTLCTTNANALTVQYPAYLDRSSHRAWLCCEEKNSSETRKFPNANRESKQIRRDLVVLGFICRSAASQTQIATRNTHLVRRLCENKIVRYRILSLSRL